MLYEQILELMGIMDRVLPQILASHTPEGSGLILPAFSPSQNSVVEAKTEGVWRLNIDPRFWRFDEEIPPRYTNPSGKRWYVRCITQHGSAWEDQVVDTPQDLVVPLPPGVRLWHASEEARRLLLLAKHDLTDLFRSDEGNQDLPHDYEMSSCDGTLTLLVTPKCVLGFRDGISLLRENSPYLTRLCLEYARTACWLYGLSMEEMCSLTRMSISRRVGGTPISLHKDGGGFYDSGPMLSVVVGHSHILHDFSPSLMTHVRGFDHAVTPVRVRVPEGVLVVIDGYARSSYGHGYTTEPKMGGHYYTIDFGLDCMRETRLLGYVKETGGMVMYTPVVDQHVVQFNQGSGIIGNPPSSVLQRAKTPLLHGVNPCLDLVRTIRTRLQNTESLLLASHTKSSIQKRKEDLTTSATAVHTQHDEGDTPA